MPLRFLSFFKTERRVWPWLALLVVGGAWLVAWLSEGDEASEDPQPDKGKIEKYERFLQQVAPENPKGQTNAEMPALHPFDPNKDDSAMLTRAGLRPWLARTLLHYRAAGGRFRKPEDLKRIYGMGESEYRKLRPYIRISLSEEPHTAYEPMLPSYVANKMHKGEKLNLATADTTALKRIPGVGTYWARRIVRYGELLGGYISVGQIKEIKNLPQGVEDYVYVENPRIEKLNLNTLPFRELLRHPYLSYEQVKAIVNRRQREGDLVNLKQLSTDTAFTTADLKRLEPYVTFVH